MKIMKHTTLLLSAAIVALTAACSSKDKTDTIKEESLPIVEVEQVEVAEVPRATTYTASVEPYIINNISAQQALRIKAIYVDEGMRVSHGQKLVVLDDVNTTSYELQVSTAQAALKNAETEYNRASELFKIGGGTRQVVEQMEVQVVNARNNLAAAQRALRNARENSVLTSPVNGVITARNYDPGDMTGQLPILTVGQVQPVKITINVSEADFPYVHKGMQAPVIFDTYPDREFTATVSLISPTVDAATKTFGVELTLPNSDNKILPGMFARVTLNFGSATHVVVPDRAVVKQPGSGNHYVYVYSSGMVSYNKVELGQRLDNKYEIISGVEPGAEVVTVGQSKLANGMKVQLKSANK